MTGSNRRPPACKAGALPAELIPRFQTQDARPKNQEFFSCILQLVSCFSQLVGLAGFEPATPRLSSVCSNQLSYKPGFTVSSIETIPERQPIGVGVDAAFSRKEVIQPQVPLRLPCYDFTPVMKPSVVSALLAVRLPTSARFHSHGVTGGVYKTRERIHRDMLIRDY